MHTSVRAGNDSRRNTRQRGKAKDCVAATRRRRSDGSEVREKEEKAEKEKPSMETSRSASQQDRVKGACVTGGMTSSL